MALYTSIKILLFTQTIFVCISTAYGDFCEWFTCDPAEQYCCGNNKCCNYFNYNTLYLWGGAILVGLLLVVTYYLMCSPACKSRSDNEQFPIIDKMGELS